MVSDPETISTASVDADGSRSFSIFRANTERIRQLQRAVFNCVLFLYLFLRGWHSRTQSITFLHSVDCRTSSTYSKDEQILFYLEVAKSNTNPHTSTCSLYSLPFKWYQKLCVRGSNLLRVLHAAFIFLPEQDKVKNIS